MRHNLQDKFTFAYPRDIKIKEQLLECFIKDKERRDINKTEDFSITLGGKIYTDREKAGERIRLFLEKAGHSDKEVNIGTYQGFEVKLFKDYGKTPKICLHGNWKYDTELGVSASGNTIRIENILKRLDEKISNLESDIDTLHKNMKDALLEYEKPFGYEDILKEKLKRLSDLNEELNLDKSDNEIIDEDIENLPPINDNDSTSEGDLVSDSKVINEEKSDFGAINEEKSISDSSLINEGNSNTSDVTEGVPITSKLIYCINYQKLNKLIPDILSGEKDYMKLKSSGFMDLVVEKIGCNEISLAHYYEQNGDLMRDPEITLRIDNNSKSAMALTFLQDNMGIYQEIYPEEGKVYPKLEKSINKFLGEWLDNIRDQGFTPKEELEEGFGHVNDLEI